MEFPVGALERLLNALDILHDLQLHDLTDVDPGGIADQSEDRLVQPFRCVQADALFLQPAAQIVQLLFTYIFFQKNNHFSASKYGM